MTTLDLRPRAALDARASDVVHIEPETTPDLHAYVVRNPWSTVAGASAGVSAAAFIAAVFFLDQAAWLTGLALVALAVLIAAGWKSSNWTPTAAAFNPGNRV
jgi:hypothetical protein